MGNRRGNIKLATLTLHSIFIRYNSIYTVALLHTLYSWMKHNLTLVHHFDVRSTQDLNVEVV